jgi:hypothetical protein
MGESRWSPVKLKVPALVRLKMMKAKAKLKGKVLCGALRGVARYRR